MGQALQHLATLHVASSSVKFQRKPRSWGDGAWCLQGWPGLALQLLWDLRGLGHKLWLLVSFPSDGWCGPAVQEVFSSTAVVFVQPGRVVRVLFAFVIRSTERLQSGGRKSLISCVCSQVLG